MVAGSTGDEEHPAAAPDLVHVILDASKEHGVLVKVDTPPHGVHHRLRLLEDLLLHERAEVS